MSSAGRRRPPPRSITLRRARTLDAFADWLRDEIDLDVICADRPGAVHQTMTLAHTSLWLREIGRG